MQVSRNKFAIAAIAACIPFSSYANGLGVSVNLGGISTDVSVGRGSIASANVGFGKSGSDSSVSAGVDIGSSSGGSAVSASVGIGGSGGGNTDGGGGSGGSSGGGGTGGGGSDSNSGNTMTTAAMPGLTPPAAPVAGATADLVGTTIWTRDNVLIGVVTEVRSGSGNNMMLSVEVVDNFGIEQNVVIFQIGVQSVSDGRLTLNLMRNELIAQLA